MFGPIHCVIYLYHLIPSRVDLEEFIFHTQMHPQKKEKKKEKKGNLAGEKLQLLKTHFSQPNFLYIFVRKSKPLCGAGPNPFSGT